MKEKYLLLMAFTLSSIIGYGQTTVLDNTIHWTSVESIELYSGQHIADTFSITINKNFVALRNNEFVKNFQIENLSGSWTNLSEEGKLMFDIPIKDFIGKGSIQNEGGVVSLVIDFSERKDWMKRKFLIKD